MGAVLLRVALWTAALLGAAAAVAQPAHTLHALFAEYGEATAHDVPEWAPWRGNGRRAPRPSTATP
jgi:hypothetical protein